MNLRRGLSRLALGAVALWFVFWTFAYVLQPRVSENAPPPSAALSWTAEIALGATAVLLLPWIVLGFRSR